MRTEYQFFQPSLIPKIFEMLEHSRKFHQTIIEIAAGRIVTPMSSNSLLVIDFYLKQLSVKVDGLVIVLTGEHLYVLREAFSYRHDVKILFTAAELKELDESLLRINSLVMAAQVQDGMDGSTSAKLPPLSFNVNMSQTAVKLLIAYREKAIRNIEVGGDLDLILHYQQKQQKATFYINQLLFGDTNLKVALPEDLQLIEEAFAPWEHPSISEQEKAHALILLSNVQSARAAYAKAS